jgi:hypothetical protein
VQVVFDRPVASRSVGEDSGRERAGRDIGSPFGFDLVAALDPALDHGDNADFREARGPRIGTLRIDPVDHMGNRMGTNLDPAVLLADGLDPLDLVGWSRFEIALDIGMGNYGDILPIALKPRRPHPLGGWMLWAWCVSAALLSAGLRIK